MILKNDCRVRLYKVIELKPITSSKSNIKKSVEIEIKAGSEVTTNC